MDKNNVPRHVAIIMDGNGRWATRKGLPRQAGHPQGAETFRTIATACKNLGVDYLTVYAFSTENWKRPPKEVKAILGLLRKYLLESIDTMARDGIRLKFLGDTSVLPKDLQTLVHQTDTLSESIAGMQANVCFNYGGRAEIVRAIKRAASQGVELSALTEETFGCYLDSSGIPDPDLVIRTAGEQRLSNFLLWQTAYAEFVFSDVLWPDFTTAHLEQAFSDYASRIRRFGAVT